MTCVPGKDLAKLAHLGSLSLLFLHEEALGLWLPIESLAKTQIRLRLPVWCMGWFVSLLGTLAILHIFLSSCSIILRLIQIIRMFNSCEVQNENSITSITVWPRDAEHLFQWRNFQFAPNNYYGFFFLHTLHSTTAFGLEYLFYQFHAKITAFLSKKCSVRLLSKKLTWKRLAQNDVKNDTPSCKMKISRTGGTRGKPCWVCKKTLSEPHHGKMCLWGFST